MGKLFDIAILVPIGPHPGNAEKAGLCGAVRAESNKIVTYLKTRLPRAQRIKHFPFLDFIFLVRDQTLFAQAIQ